MSELRRAYKLTLEVNADSRAALMGYMHHFLHQLACDQVTTGCSGGPDSGATYSLDIDESITHDLYFKRLHAWLAERDTNKSDSPPTGDAKVGQK